MPLRLVASKVVLKVLANKALFVVIGVVATMFIGISTALWYQTNQLQKSREAGVVLSTLLAQEIKQTEHLRSVIDNQNKQIEQIAKNAKQAEREANRRVNELLKERSKLITESEKLPPGPGDMNQWFVEQF
jgi:uncharacterized protein HemX